VVFKEIHPKILRSYSVARNERAATMNTNFGLASHRFPSPSFTEGILADERWYGDGEPNWPVASTAEHAQERRLFCAKRLRRFQALDLAARLKACRPGERCQSGACPECGRAFQRWFVHSTTALISASDHSGDLVSVSIVPPKARAPSFDINTLSLADSIAAVTQALQGSSDVDWMIGGIDVSLNDDTQKGLQREWQPQLYGVAIVKDRDALRSRLRSTFKPTKDVSRPVQIKTCDGSARVISYAYKTEFVERIAYYAPISRKRDSRKCWMTRKVSLRARDHEGLMEWLDSVGLAQRLLVFRVQTVKATSGVTLKVKLLE
jgi:hypothetical protein